MFDFLIAFLLALASGTTAQPVDITIHYGSGIVMDYQVEVEEGLVASFDMMEKVVTIGSTHLEVGDGDIVCLPLTFVPQQMHRIAVPDGDPYNGRGCFAVTSQAISSQ